MYTEHLEDTEKFKEKFDCLESWWLIGLWIAHLSIAHHVANPELGNPEIHMKSWSSRAMIILSIALDDHPKWSPGAMQSPPRVKILSDQNGWLEVVWQLPLRPGEEEVTTVPPSPLSVRTIFGDFDDDESWFNPSQWPYGHGDDVMLSGGFGRSPVKSPSHGDEGIDSEASSSKVKVNLVTNGSLVFWIWGGCEISVRWALGVNSGGQQ